MREFELRTEHIRLLSNAHVCWEDCESGAPCIDPKRPYGNSGVATDILEMFEIPPASNCKNCGVEYSEEQRQGAMKTHRETELALQIILSTQSFVPGVYIQGDEYDKRSWKKKGA